MTRAIIFFLAVLLAQPLFAQDSRIGKSAWYRYVDDKGNTVIQTYIPPDMARRGYDIIDQHGRLIERVARTLTQDEIDNLAQENRDEIERKKLEEKQREYDVDLLRKYSFVSDIEAELKRKLREQRVRITILKGNLTAVRSELEQEYSAAAKIEAGGRELPEALKTRIESLEEKITTTEELLVKRRSAKDLLEKEYGKRIARFKEIQKLRGK